MVGRQGLTEYLEVAVSLLPVSGVLAALSGVGTAALVAVAQRTGRTDLSAGREASGELEGG
jgi:hypothetical protein